MCACVCACARALSCSLAERSSSLQAWLKGPSPSLSWQDLVPPADDSPGWLATFYFNCSLPPHAANTLPSIVRCQGNRVMTGTAYHWVNTPLHETSILGMVLYQSAIFSTLYFHNTSHSNLSYNLFPLPSASPQLRRLPHQFAISAASIPKHGVAL